MEQWNYFTCKHYNINLSYKPHNNPQFLISENVLFSFYFNSAAQTLNKYIFYFYSKTYCDIKNRDHASVN